MNTSDRPIPIGLPFLRRFTSRIAKGPVDGEAYLRLHHYAVFVSLGVPTMLVFAAVNLAKGMTLMGSMILVSALGLSGGLFALLRLGWGPWVYRVNFLYFASITSYGAHYGGDGGSYGLWAYSYPLIAFFLFGLREGLAWALVMQAGVVAAMLLPGGYEYPMGFVLRFATSYAMVVGITYGYEHLRNVYRRAMEAEHLALHGEIAERRRAEADKEALIGELRQALDEVKTLRGLIPICAGCHQIRDDGGFWQRLESYLEDRSDARFSHGLCPACAHKYYPDIAEKPTDGADRPREP